jgi:VWFA-related protein
VRWTPNADEIPSAVFSRPAHGRTALWDAVHLALEQFKQAHKRRHALVIFSDGGDNFSRFSQTQIARELAEADVQVYAIDTSELFAIRNQYVDEMPVANPLADMSDRAGGRYFQLASRQDAQKVAQQIGRELRSQYVLGYSPSRQSLDGKLHAIQLRVQRPEGSPRLSVFWRRGYRAPLF